MKKYLGLIIGLLPLVASAQLVITNNYYVVMSGGVSTNPTSLVLTNPAPAGISNTGGGWIVSENEFNQVDWSIGTNTGSYMVPFGYGTDYLPVTCNITTAGTGSGMIKFATYHGATWDNSTYKPSDVTNMADFGAADYSNNAIDRFWILDANTGYTTKPTSDITFTYIRSGASSEIAAPNFIPEWALIAQRFNSTGSSDVWSDWFGITGTNVTTANTGTISSGSVPPADFYRSWSLFADSNLIKAGIPDVNDQGSAIKVYPNPSNGNFTIVVSGTTDKSTVEVYNTLGQQLFVHSLASGSNTLEIGSLSNAIYFYRVISQNGQLIGQGKLIIQK